MTPESSFEPLETAKQCVASSDDKWVAPSTVNLSDGRHWKPSLSSADGRELLAILTGDRILPFLEGRLRTAKADGFGLSVALSVEALYSEALLDQLSSLDVQVLVLDRNGECWSQAPLLRVLTDAGVLVGPDLRRRLASVAYAECERDVSSQSRGRRFEGLLGFLFGQTGGLRVVEHNFRTATEELDLVLQLDSLDGPRCWCHLGKPFVLVEAKFWKDPVDQQVISTFHTKLEGKRNAALLGLVFGRNGFTADAQTQVIRFSLDEYVMALIGPNELREWIDASNPDDHLEKLVRRAWLA